MKNIGRLILIQYAVGREIDALLIRHELTSPFDNVPATNCGTYFPNPLLPGDHSTTMTSTRADAWTDATMRGRLCCLPGSKRPLCNSPAKSFPTPEIRRAEAATVRLARRDIPP